MSNSENIEKQLEKKYADMQMLREHNREIVLKAQYNAEIDEKNPQISHEGR